MRRRIHLLTSRDGAVAPRLYLAAKQHSGANDDNAAVDRGLCICLLALRITIDADNPARVTALQCALGRACSLLHRVPKQAGSAITHSIIPLDVLATNWTCRRRLSLLRTEELLDTVVKDSLAHMGTLAGNP
jgi:hypothetical protein